MGYLACNGDGAISACDPSIWDCKKISPASSSADAPSRIRKFRFPDILAATDGFSASNFLGKGSHGSVYRALLDDGRLLAAVKRTKVGSSPSNNEAGVLSRIKHRRLVNLIGFCDDANDGMFILVMEYMPNGSLHELLHGPGAPPGLARRIRLVLQVAKAVRWLHSLEPSVIHRDIKSCNVLIDEKQNARLGDFGLALREQTEDSPASRTPPAGTLGYLDPSYLAPGDLSTKSDVFSFGILLLEILSGRNAIDLNYSPPSVVDWAVPLIRRKEFAAVCDERMDLPADGSIARDIALVAARCVRTTVRKRPEMAEVVEALKGISRRIDAMRVLGGLSRRRHGRGQGPWPRTKQEDDTIEFTSPNLLNELEPHSDNFTKRSPSHELGRTNPWDWIGEPRWEAIKTGTKGGTSAGRNMRKASKVHARMARSKSVGSSRESGKTEGAGIRNHNRRSIAVAKWPTVATAMLSKSRSTGDEHRSCDEGDRLLERPLFVHASPPS